MDEKSCNKIDLSQTRDRVAHLGARLSFLLVQFFFAVSNREEELMKNFDNLRELLMEPRNCGGRLVVDRIFALLETGEKEVRDKLANIEKLKDNAEEKEPVQLKHSEVIVKIYEQIVFLEEILGYVFKRCVWGERLLEDFNFCDKELDEIGKKIQALGSFRNLDFIHLREAMDERVREIWSGFELLDLQ